MPFPNGTWMTYFSQSGIQYKSITFIYGGKSTSTVTIPC
ncbi:Hypothetical protein PMT_2511 [Prochlorococcus marinus str. MIT 9313]|uniref:Uncharacterized protein n=1 Tax=Prochlorococcus marinus (strain MIT 9313) TaxID=74547 RepID=B9ERS9_PROMM|nr:Hypothetical protein PMT_2511 [Prochlorococcus marinus str. MIT 9313]